MDVFTNNPLANMVGPYFLLFYASLLAIFLFLGRRIAKSLDSSDQLEALPVPENPNPFEIAFLRGGANEVARLLVVELFQRGILIETPKSLLQKTKLKLADNIDLYDLDPTLRSMAERFIKPRDPCSFDAQAVQSSLATQLEYWTNWIQNERLVFEPAQRSSSQRYGWMLTGVFVAVGVYKLVIAISNNHYNVIFLVLLGLLGSIGILAVSRLPRFTSRGRRYMADLQSAFWSFKNSTLPKPNQYQPELASSAGAWDPLLAGAYAMPVMAMGLFGATALQSSYYSTIAGRFATSGSSCGAVSTCGSSCGGGGGGGGSGCGGGGGGCGGGCGGCGS